MIPDDDADPPNTRPNVPPSDGRFDRCRQSAYQTHRFGSSGGRCCDFCGRAWRDCLIEKQHDDDSTRVATRSLESLPGDLPQPAAGQTEAFAAHTLTLEFGRFLAAAEWREVHKQVCAHVPYVLRLIANAVPVTRPATPASPNASDPHGADPGTPAQREADVPLPFSADSTWPESFI